MPTLLPPTAETTLELAQPPMAPQAAIPASEPTIAVVTESADQASSDSPNLQVEEAAEAFDSSEHEWPEPEPASSGRQEGHEPSKRKRRRKKNKNHQQATHAGTVGPDDQETAGIPTVVETADASVKPNPPANQQPRHRHDPELLAKYAWKIYLAEVSEEGVALIGDHDAKDLARRCFRLAEFFLEEQSRRR